VPKGQHGASPGRPSGRPNCFQCYDALMQYQTLRSVSDQPVFVVCRDGTFYERVPVHVEGTRAPAQLASRLIRLEI